MARARGSAQLVFDDFEGRPRPPMPNEKRRGLWDGREDKVYFFELRLDRLPELQLDNREIIAARLISPSESRGMALTGPVAVYLGRTIPPGCHSE
jgi:8-oxo-dGTP diphosphatase